MVVQDVIGWTDKHAESELGADSQDQSVNVGP